MDYFAVGQCTPGVIAVNTATFIGYKNRGIPGAAAATAGVIFPSLVIIMIIASFLQSFAHLEAVSNAFSGIRAAVAALVVNAIIRLWKSGIQDAFGIVVFAAVFVISAFFDVSPIYMVILSVLAGILYCVRGGAAK